MREYIQNVIDEQKENLEKFEKDIYKDELIKIAGVIIDALKAGKKILIAGNGGSAADAQHFAAELVGRFETERMGLSAIALTTDSSIITSVANDYSFNKIFSRQIEAIATAGDVFVGISTSGNSSDIVEAVASAKSKGIFTIGMLGKDGGELKSMCDIPFVVPSKKTARIQELHEMSIHIICAFIDQAYEKYM